MQTIYDNLTDAELIRHVAENEEPLIRALAERLEMRGRELEDANAAPAPYADATTSHVQGKNFVR